MTLLRYECFGERVVAFSTERGAVADVAAPYDGFNINPYCGDTAEHIADSRRALCSWLGIADERLVLPHQVHGTRVACLDRNDSLEGADAVMSSQHGVCIGVSTADCIPVLLHDVRHDAVCAVHSGWRGTVAHITALALEAMAHEYGTRREDVVAAIGPGIRLAAFEVGDEVYDAFAAAGFDTNSVAQRIGTKWHIDLVAAVKTDLLGVPHIHDCGLCTYTLPHRFFSARRLGLHSARLYSALMLR